jgi:hypothetical protein
MARVEPEAFEDQELIRVFMAGTLRDALRAEEVLTERGVNYVVEVEPYGRTLLGSPRNGAAFYVADGQAQYCGAQLVAAGLGRGVLIE